jgi:hypothetical protein
MTDMTPDTSVYMIAGIAVILGGAVIYIFTLMFRNHRVNSALRSMENTDSSED